MLRQKLPHLNLTSMRTTNSLEFNVEKYGVDPRTLGTRFSCNSSRRYLSI